MHFSSETAITARENEKTLIIIFETRTGTPNQAGRVSK
jgi:hypothetical protein